MKIKYSLLAAALIIFFISDDIRSCRRMDGKRSQ